MLSTNNDWDRLLENEIKSEYFVKLWDFILEEYERYTIYPPKNNIFNCLRYTAYSETSVVILGQDPYHGPDQAHGLCFSVKEGVKPPPSLKNIFKELNIEYNMPVPKSGELYGWAKQGVLLLNTTLTVREGKPQSHTGRGWERFTDEIIKLLNKSEKPIVFMLWGANAREKKTLISNPCHLILESCHPSPLSAYHGFFGCNHFTLANEFLTANNRPPIDWTRTNE